MGNMEGAYCLVHGDSLVWDNYSGATVWSLCGESLLGVSGSVSPLEILTSRVGTEINILIESSGVVAGSEGRYLSELSNSLRVEIGCVASARYLSHANVGDMSIVPKLLECP